MTEEARKYAANTRGRPFVPGNPGKLAGQRAVENPDALADLAEVMLRTLGDGPFDLLIVPGFVSHLEQAWEDPSYARFL
jgi:hypothetical protein